jgi:DNA-binding transcriptional ArsR family regulator
MDEFIRVMKALSDPSRVKLLKMLQERVMCVCELRAALRLAQPTVSKHLKILEEAGLVRREKDGLWVNYTISGGRSPTRQAFWDISSTGCPKTPMCGRCLKTWIRFAARTSASRNKEITILLYINVVEPNL